MGYELSATKLRALTQDILDDAEISHFMSIHGITPEYIYSEVIMLLLPRASTILASLDRSKLMGLEELQGEIAHLTNPHREDEPEVDEDTARQNIKIKPAAILANAFAAHRRLLSTGAAAILILLAASYWVLTQYTAFLSQVMSPAWVQPVSIMLGVLLFALFFAIVLRMSRRQLIQEQLAELRNAEEENEAATRKSLREYREIVASTIGAFDSEVTASYVKPAVIEIINRFETGTDEMSLAAKYMQGLSEVPNRIYEAPTAAGNVLERLINGMNGGSFGIAGPRGVGKSTLLRSFCVSDPGMPQPEQMNEPVRTLAVIISVPVKYELKDFVLQIFLSVCKEVLKYGKLSGADQLEDEEPPARRTASVLWQGFLDKLPLLRTPLRLILLSSAVGILLSVSWTRSNLYSAAMAPPATPTAVSVSTASPPAQEATAVAAATTSSDSSGAAAVQPAPDSRSSEPTPTYLDALITLGVGPGFLFKLSTTFFLLAALAIYVYRTDQRARRSKGAEAIELLQLRSRLLDRLDSIEWDLERNHRDRRRQAESQNARDLLVQEILDLEKKLSREDSLDTELARLDHSKSGRPEIRVWQRLRQNYFSEELCRHAIRHIKNIRFQQSFTSGSTGSIKLPFSLEAGLEYGASLVRNQRSLPEIVEEYKDFISRLTAKGTWRVIIGIDELDKIASIDAARLFINEIKAIFGIPGCFYLLSVSENAMSNYERRGLPFRDEFDSAFDQVLYIDYLDYRAARELLNTRVFGMPPRFKDLAYVLSGGLPRDLIRYCRSIFEYAQTVPDEVPFNDASTKVISDDIRSKIRATNITIGELEIPGTSYDLLSYVNRLESQVDQPLELIRTLSQMKQIIAERNQSIPDGQFEDIVKAEIVKIRGFHAALDELISYVYFLLTVLTFFNVRSWSGHANYSAFVSTTNGADLARLARCRQAFSISPQHAYGLITHFRKIHGWVLIEAIGQSDTGKNSAAPGGREKQPETRSEEAS